MVTTKSKTYNRYRKTKKKGTQAYYRKKSNHNRKNKKEMNKNNWKIRSKMAVSTYL